MGCLPAAYRPTVPSQNAINVKGTKGPRRPVAVRNQVFRISLPPHLILVPFKPPASPHQPPPDHHFIDINFKNHGLV